MSDNTVESCLNQWLNNNGFVLFVPFLIGLIISIWRGIQSYKAKNVDLKSM